MDLSLGKQVVFAELVSSSNYTLRLFEAQSNAYNQMTLVYAKLLLRVAPVRARHFENFQNIHITG